MHEIVEELTLRLTIDSNSDWSKDDIVALRDAADMLEKKMTLGKLDSVDPDEGFDYFSGYADGLHSCPCMYISKLTVTVTGPRFKKEYATIYEAFPDYARLVEEHKLERR